MRKFRLALTTLFVPMLGLYAGCNMGPKGPLTVPLEFRPGRVDSISTAVSAVDVKVHVAPVKDKRENKDQIGENVEDPAAPIPVFSSGKSPTEFVQDQIVKELEESGLDFTDAAEAADRVIEIDLTRFWVREEDSFRAEVQVIAQIRDKGGSVKWRERVAGEGSTGGLSLNPENYQETLSDATQRMIERMLNNPKFQATLTR